MAYGLYLYKNVTTKGNRVVRLEIWSKDYTGSSAEIEAMGASPFAMSIDNSGGGVEEPLIKTNLNIVIKDTNQVDYDLFFTPDATKFKVIIKISGVDYWVGYLTPDSYSESLSYRSDIVLTARDNLGMLSEIKYERAGKRATMRTLLNEAMALISFGNTLEYRQKKTSGTLNILDAYIRCDRFIGKTWADVVQTILHDCGLQMRFVGAAKYAIYDIGEIVNLGTTISTQTFKFIEESGQREIIPAARTITLNQDYGSVDNSYDGVLADSEYSFRAARSVSQPVTKDISTPQVFTINYYDPFSIVWSGAGGSMGIVNPNEWNEAPSTIMLTGDLYTFTNYRPAIYYSQIMPITAGNVEVKFQVSNLVKYPATSGSDYVWKDYFFEYIKDPSSALVEWFGAKYQVKFRCNIFLQGATKTYIMRERWEEYIDEGPTATAKYLTFVLPSGGNAGEFPNLWEYNAKDEELKFNIQTIPEDGTLRIAFYPYELIGQFVQLYPSVEPQDIKDNIPLTYPILVKNISIKYPAFEVGGLESSAIINSAHNVAYNIDLELGQVPQGIGDSATMYGGLFNTGVNFYKALGDFFVTAGTEYHLSELIGREIANIYKEQREKLSGTIITDVNFSAMPSFGKTFTDGIKYYAINSGTLDFISEQMQVEMIEVEPYLYEDFTFIEATIESGGGSSMGAGEKTFVQWSAAGNAKRIYQLDTALPEEMEAAYVMVDKSGLTEAKKVDVFALLDQKEDLLPATPSDPESKFLNGNREWSLINLGSGGNSPKVYFTSLASDVSGYKVLSYEPEATTSYCTTVLTNEEELCNVFLYPLGVGVELLDAGTWEFDIYAKVSGTAGNVTMRAEVFKRTTGGVETILFSKSSEVINNTDYEYIKFIYTSPSIPVNSTDRIGVRIYGKNTIAAAITLTWALGDGDASFFVTPLAMRHSQLRGKNDEAGFQHITQGNQTFEGIKTFSGAFTDMVENRNTNLRIPKVAPTSATADEFYLYSLDSGFSGELPSGAGSVTSIALTMPTGFSVSGSPITESGTFGVTFASGYFLPTTTQFASKLDVSLKGSPNGLAELDENGFVKNTQLPSYVDDVLEYDNLAAFPATGESGKIYIAKDTNKTYRWSGTGYAVISETLALGETSSTAYRGDRGKIAYDHSQLTGNPHGATTTNISEGTNLYYTDARVATYGDNRYLRIATASSSSTNAAFAIGSASGRNFIQSHNSQPLDINPLGNAVTINGYIPYHSGNSNLTTIDWSAKNITLAGSITGATTITASSTIQATTAKLTNLTNGYIPYHISDASGLGNSTLYYNGTNYGIGTTSPTSKLHIETNTWNAGGYIPFVKIINLDGNAVDSAGLLVQGGALSSISKILDVQDYNGVSKFYVLGDGNSVMGGNLAIAGALSGVTTLFASGIVSLTNTTQSTAYTNGALVLSGGLGIAKDLYSNGKGSFNTLIIPQVAPTLTSGEMAIYGLESGFSGELPSGAGSVTSISMVVPTGLSVTPTTITESGTFTISYASDYSIPTNTKQSEWDNAYTLRHNAVTLGTANGLSLSTQELSLGLASTSTNGALSSTDWNTFNGKQAKLIGTGASSLVRVNTLGVVTYDDNTYLTGNQTITLSGIITGSGTTAITTAIADGALSIAKTNGLQSALDAKMATASYPDLVAIEALSGTSGLLKKTASNTWTLDTNTYLTAITKAQVEAVLTGTITSHNHNGTYALLAGSTSQAFSVSSLTMNGALSGATTINTKNGTNGGAWFGNSTTVNKFIIGSDASIGGVNEDILGLYCRSADVEIWATGTRMLKVRSIGVEVIGTIQATTAKLTNLTDGYIPYHISDASGLGNSTLYYNGTNYGIGTASPGNLLNIYRNSSSSTPILRIEDAGTGDASMAFAITGVAGFSMGIDNSDGKKFKIAGGGSDVGSNTYLTIVGSGGGAGNIDVGYGGTRTEKFAVNGSGYFNGALAISGALSGVTTLSASGIISLTNTTQSTAYTNGGLILSGGLGIAKDLYSNGKAVFASSVQMLENINTNLRIPKVAPTSPTSGEYYFFIVE